MATATNPPTLRYYGTNTDVKVGDRIEFRTMVFRRRHTGTVVCIPEKTGRELDKLGKSPEDWLLKLDSGVITGWFYSPEDLQPPARLKFISRATGLINPVSNAAVEEAERKGEDSASWLELAAPVGILFVVLLLISAGWVFLRVGT